jgi:hypothetical protein
MAIFGSRSREIPTPVVPEDGRFLKFSFKYIDLHHEDFPLQACSQEFFTAFLEKLRHYSQWTVEEFSNQNNDDRRHNIDFRETRFADGFTHITTEQLEYYEAWQFEIGPPGNRWRVYGLLLAETFFVIWLDARHYIWLPRE